MVPSKLCIENVEIFKGVLTTIELGLTMFGHEITSICTEFLQAASSFLYRYENNKLHEAYNLLKPFLKVILYLNVSFIFNIFEIICFPYFLVFDGTYIILSNKF